MDRTPAREAAAAPAGADAAARAAALIAAVEDAYTPAPATPTAYRDTTPVPTVGTAAPVVQPGRAPMSQKATDASALMLAAGAGTLMAGTGAGVALWALAGVDPLALALAAGAPVALVAALTRLVRRAGQAAEKAAPTTNVYNVSGPVDIRQERHSTTARGVFARTTTRF
ncbi:hypothetical protein [Streptomyces nitrosporeus]|uniref:hypothetical protein n=1 Tax=Streptomyces nitrosporeus TaxID=28894 RepID=UPI00167EC031|nr:hypothetical protein [Streptomyces nitrosporeus]GGZ29818.1 hypothetical protein GCM10010327_70110 [Streptomyces nitrosporeus]